MGLLLDVAERLHGHLEATARAVGITHAQRGNVKGATSLLRSASTRLAHAGGPGRHGIDVVGLAGFADALIDDLAAGVHLAPQQLRPRLAVVEPDRA